jgi:hypothetical protein
MIGMLMMIDLSKINLKDILPYLPAAFGALLGTRYRKAQTLRERLLAWVLSLTMGYYVGGALGAYFSLPEATTYGIMFSIGSVGMEIVAYVMSALREGILHPSTTAGRWIDVVLGRPIRELPDDIKVHDTPRKEDKPDDKHD